MQPFAPQFVPLTDAQVSLLKARCKRMPRLRHQDGHVKKLGRRPYWKGFYFEYVLQPDGSEKRIHRSISLGLVSEMKKWEAEKKLRLFLDTHLDENCRAKGGAGSAGPAAARRFNLGVTFNQFWEERFLPIARGRWERSTLSNNCWIVRSLLAPRFGEVELTAITRFDVQVLLDEIARKYSASGYKQARQMLGSILAEAVEQGLIARSPAAKIKAPALRKPQRFYLAAEEIAAIVAQLEGRNRVIVRMFVVLGLRPSEMFALRRDDVLANGYLRVDESSWRGIIKGTKTEASNACVWMPDSIRRELEWWLEASAIEMPKYATDDALLFPSRRGTPLRTDNVLKRIVKTAAERAFEALTDEERAAGLLRDHKKRVTHQTFRRSCGTLMKQHGDLKDVQGHLRHATPDITAEVYIQTIPESVRAAVKALDAEIFGFGHKRSHGADPR